MTPNDKNYVDRLHNQQVNELNEIKNRLLILEGEPITTPGGTIRVEIDIDKVYEIFLKACHDCLQQRQERLQEEDRQAAVASPTASKPISPAHSPSTEAGPSSPSFSTSYSS